MEKALEVSHLRPENLFWFAYCFYEVRLPYKVMSRQFLNYINHDLIPECVEDYCFEILTHRK